MMGLTVRQDECLRLLRAAVDAGQPVPSIREIADTLGLRSTSGVHRIICGLEDRGLVRRLHRKARAVELVDDRQSVILSTLDDLVRDCVVSRARSRDVSPAIIINEALHKHFLLNARD